MQTAYKVIGPFREVVSMTHLPLKGPLRDEQLDVLPYAGILLEGEQIHSVDDFERLAAQARSEDWQLEELRGPLVALPGLVDCHTHICWAGSRARDYAMRVAGLTYLEIARAGGGIPDTVEQVRSAGMDDLLNALLGRASRHLREGVTTCEVKSGYGLDTANELKMLQVIQQAGSQIPMDLIPTCLAAHVPPPEYRDRPDEYLDLLLQELLPSISSQHLAQRVDIFVEESAFSVEQARRYLQGAAALGFSLTLHADQFSVGGSRLACELGAVSADHLEASGEADIQALAQSTVTAVALPGASLGLGCNFAPVRRLLDAGAAVAIATDWNPGSAPMGDLLTQAALLGASEKLSTAETLAGITLRAAAALELYDRGQFARNCLADIIAFPCDDYREILYHQGKMKPEHVWKNGQML